MRVAAAFLAALLSTAAAQAGESAGPLIPGKPAGVQKAQTSDQTILYIMGAGLVVGGIALISGSNGRSNPSGGSSGSSGTSP